jgi:hypothetical protein
MNPSLYHKFLDISIVPAGLNPIEVNKPLDVAIPTDFIAPTHRSMLPKTFWRFELELYLDRCYTSMVHRLV